MAETLCYDYARTHDESISVARIFNTYGPRMSSSDGQVVTNFITPALQGKLLTINGSGQQTRSFCFCDELVNGLVALMNSEVQVPVNLGNPHEITIYELADRIQTLLNPAPNLIYRPLPIDDPQRRRPDIERAETLLNWQPTVKLEKVLEITIADLRSQLKQPNLQAG